MAGEIGLAKIMRDDQKLQHFFKDVMLNLGHHGWTLNIQPGREGYCWTGRKRIDMGRDYPGDLRQLLLHEIAHIEDPARFRNAPHNQQFWWRVEDLVRKWLKTGLDERQLFHRQYMAEKCFYSLAYRRD